MLSFQCENFVICFLRYSLALVGSGIEFLSLLISYLNILSISMVNSDLVLHLLSHDINLLSESLVFSLELIEMLQVLIQFVFSAFHFFLIFLNISGGWSNLLQLLLLLKQFFSCLLQLIFQDHQTPILKLKPSENYSYKLNSMNVKSINIEYVTYFFSCSNFLVKLSASL